MPKIVDTNLQAKLLAEANELYDKRARIEASLRAADALCNHRIETAASREIHNHRSGHPATLEAHGNKSETRAIAPTTEDKSPPESV
ncbi:MAG: hypothetical protein ACREQO_15855 [Candidatus Binatia bacterium]